MTTQYQLFTYGYKKFNLWSKLQNSMIQEELSKWIIIDTLSSINHEMGKIKLSSYIDPQPHPVFYQILGNRKSSGNLYLYENILTLYEMYIQCS